MRPASPWGGRFRWISALWAVGVAGLEHPLAPVPVVFSCLVYEPVGDVRDLVANAMKFGEASTRMVLHLNALQNYTRSDVDGLVALGGGGGAESRVLINPRRLAVKWGNYNMTYAFLLNARHVYETIESRDALVLWQDSNMFFFRPCVERYVRATRCTLFESYSCANKLNAYQADAAVVGFLSRNATACSRGRQIKHEGSVFPLMVLIEMLEGLEKLDAFAGRGKLGARFSEEWAFALFAVDRNCSGMRVCTYPERRDGDEVIKSPREQDFAFKRVPRTAEIAAGAFGLDVHGEPVSGSRKMGHPELKKRIRALFVNLPSPPANHTCKQVSTGSQPEPPSRMERAHRVHAR